MTRTLTLMALSSSLGVIAKFTGSAETVLMGIRIRVKQEL